MSRDAVDKVSELSDFAYAPWAELACWAKSDGLVELASTELDASVELSIWAELDASWSDSQQIGCPLESLFSLWQPPMQQVSLLLLKGCLSVS